MLYKGLNSKIGRQPYNNNIQLLWDGDSQRQ